MAEANPDMHCIMDQAFSTGSATAHHVATTKVAEEHKLLAALVLALVPCAGA